MKALKKKAQLKNFQKSKGTQNSKQATRTLQPCGHRRRKAAFGQDRVSFHVLKESSRLQPVLCAKQNPNRSTFPPSYVQTFHVGMCKSIHMVWLYQLLCLGWDPREHRADEGFALTFRYTICVSVACVRGWLELAVLRAPGDRPG